MFRDIKQASVSQEGGEGQEAELRVKQEEAGVMGTL